MAAKHSFFFFLFFFLFFFPRLAKEVNNLRPDPGRGQGNATLVEALAVTGGPSSAQPVPAKAETVRMAQKAGGRAGNRNDPIRKK